MHTDVQMDKGPVTRAKFTLGYVILLLLTV